MKIQNREVNEPPVTFDRLRYDRVSGRFAIGSRALHCGDGLELQVRNRDGSTSWFEARIEHNADGWYLLFVQPSDPFEWQNFPARFA
jgi:hypothetical protein